MEILIIIFVLAWVMSVDGQELCDYIDKQLDKFDKL